MHTAGRSSDKCFNLDLWHVWIDSICTQTPCPHTTQVAKKPAISCHHVFHFSAIIGDACVQKQLAVYWEDLGFLERVATRYLQYLGGDFNPFDIQVSSSQIWIIFPKLPSKIKAYKKQKARNGRPNSEFIPCFTKPASSFYCRLTSKSWVNKL